MFTILAGLVISMVEVGGLAGSLCSGFITDKMVEKVMVCLLHKYNSVYLLKTKFC